MSTNYFNSLLIGSNENSHSIYIAPDNEENCIDNRSISKLLYDINFVLGNYEEEHAEFDIIVAACGGDLHSCLGIYDILMNLRKLGHRVRVICWGYAVSGGVIIMQAANERIISENTIVLLHYGSISFSHHEWNHVLQNVEIAKSYYDKTIDIYARRAKNGEKFKDQSLKEVKAFIQDKLKSGDWWLTSHEALEYGFVDKVIK